MKQILILLILLFAVVVLAQAQDENPYSQFGYEGKVLKTPQGNYGTLRTIDVKNDADYNPFGMAKAQGTMASGGYLYGFNGMEKDDEMKGEGNHYSTFHRQYDPRLGRWFSKDPVIKPYLSSYHSFSNNPIIMIDPRGNTDFYIKLEDGKMKKVGHDGQDNGDVAIVYNKEDVKKIAGNNSDKLISRENLNHHFLLPPKDNRNEIFRIIEDNYQDAKKHKYELAGIGVIGEGGKITHIRSYDGSSVSGSSKRPSINPSRPHPDDREKADNLGFSSESFIESKLMNGIRRGVVNESVVGYIWHLHYDEGQRTYPSDLDFKKGRAAQFFKNNIMINRTLGSDGKPGNGTVAFFFGSHYDKSNPSFHINVDYNWFINVVATGAGDNTSAPNRKQTESNYEADPDFIGPKRPKY